MRRLCFGGSFNPIHLGHLICARAVAESAGFDRVVLIPSAYPPHKPDATDLASGADRLAMCRLAAAEQPDLFQVDDVEMVRGGRSYTVETVRALKARGWNPVFWLIGADMAKYLPQWHEPQALLRETAFVVMARPRWSFDWHSMPEAFRVLEKNVVPAPLIDIGATEIRRRVGEGRPIVYLTPEAVAKYIEERGLYGAKKKDG